MEKFSLENILKIGKIGNELELEQANSIFKKLRVLIKEDTSLKPLRKHLADLIEAYETEHWLDEEKVTEEQIVASENAEKIIQYQDQFIQKRKELIRNTLNANKLIQNDLAEILGHRKNYISELINGLRPFSQDDIITINRVFKIPFDQLIIPIVKEQTADRIRSVIRKLNQPNLKLKSTDFNILSWGTTRKSKSNSLSDREMIKETENLEGLKINLSTFSRMRENKSLILV